MATVDRVQTGYRQWSPSASGYAEPVDAVDEYVGRHRQPGARRLGLVSMFYRARHRR